MAPKHEPAEDAPGVAPPGACIARSLLDPYARTVLAAIIPQALSAREISDRTGVPIATTYRHLATLQDVGLATIERGAMTHDGKRYDLFRATVESLTMTIARDGVHIDWQPLPSQHAAHDAYDALGSIRA